MQHDPGAPADAGNLNYTNLVRVLTVACPWGPLKLRDDYPAGLDPVQVIRDYLAVVDVEGTKELRALARARAKKEEPRRTEGAPPILEGPGVTQEDQGDQIVFKGGQGEAQEGLEGLEGLLDKAQEDRGVQHAGVSLLTKLMDKAGEIGARSDIEFPEKLEEFKEELNRAAQEEVLEAQEVQRVLAGLEPVLAVQEEVQEPIKKGKRGGNRSNIQEPGPVLGLSAGDIGIKIYKLRIIELYKNLPDVFSTDEATEYFLYCYEPEKISRGTAKQKSQKYIQYMQKHGYIKVTGRDIGRRLNFYTFTAPPFGVREKPAQAEPIDVKYWQNKKIQDLRAARAEGADRMRAF